MGLKILDPQKTAAFQRRFKGLNKPSEGDIAMQLKHPRIVETYEYGMTTEGAQYLVMEFLEGPNMNTALAARDSRLMGGGCVFSVRPRRPWRPFTRPDSSIATSARETCC